MSRTLEEILTYSRETGMDWGLTAEEAGLLRREVERLRDQLASERERAATEEREAVVRHLRERAKWFDEMGRSPAGLLSDARVSEEFNEEASHIERGEHRK